jgi:hypothetical protein
MVMIIDRPQVPASLPTDRSFDRLFSPPLRQCPACGSRELEHVVEAATDEVHFFCGHCDRCWHVELGFAHPIASSLCAGLRRGDGRLVDVATGLPINK